MDPIALILITAFLNGAVSTGIFLRVQKNIESSFTEKLEEFKTSLRKEEIAYQIKFSRSYPKALEVLETFTKKFQHQVAVFCLMCEDHPPTKDKDPDNELLFKRQDEHSIPLADCKLYYDNNRLFLNDTASNEIDDILEQTKKLNLALTMLDFVFHMPGGKRIILEKFASLRDEEIATDVNDYDFLDNFALALRDEMRKLLRQVEKLYRSVAAAA
jgi:hypothetical protein